MPIRRLLLVNRALALGLIQFNFRIHDTDLARLPPKGWPYDTQLDHTKRAFSHGAGPRPPAAAPPVPFEPCLGAGAGSLSLSRPSQSIQRHKAGEQAGMPTSNPHYSPISNPSLFI